jgi:hypothetical protein
MRDKFNWAMAVPPDWEFDEKIGNMDWIVLLRKYK